jgi:two-component system, sensor histidine kinase and response regulator
MIAPLDETPAILIVDDQAVNRRLYQAILKDCGAELVLAASGDEALAASRERTFAMILLDVRLAGLSGFDVAQQLRDRDPDTASPIVFVSAMHVREHDAFRGYRLGAVDYMLSPVVPEILRAKAAVFVRLHRLRAEALAQALVVEQAYRELRSAHAELEQFSWTVSHDLRTPLAQMTSFVELLQWHAGATLDARSQQYLAHMAAVAQRMRGLIDDLLALGKVTSGDVRRESVDLSRLAGEVAAEIESTSPPHARREVQWVIEPGLFAEGDVRLLRLALANLLGNARKYCATSEQPRIELSRVPHVGVTAEHPVFCVADNGAGFDVDAAGQRLFMPFQRFHSDAAFAGSGIGLSIVQRVVVKHGGRIWAESAPGKGARFFFSLPAVAVGRNEWEAVA